jgi:putative nucleotidyltransferase with HDIG domain
MSISEKLKLRLYVAFEVALLGAVLAVTARTARLDDWQPSYLVVFLFGLTAIGQRLIVQVGKGQLTGAFIALVLAMSLLGPAPAMSFGVAVIVVSSVRRRLPWELALNNVLTLATYPFVGAMTMRLAFGDVHDPHNVATTRGVTFALLVFAVFMVALVVNFGLIALHYKLTEGRSLIRQTRELFIPFLPGETAAAALAATLAVAYTNLGFPVLLGAVLVLVIFQVLTRALLRSEERADQLEARGIHLASLQLGVLTTLVETLALRDRTTARHAAAVARYGRELAQELGCSEAEQELVHTAGLLHDIGKFALPDHILHSKMLSDEDWAVIRRHPQDGATLVGRLDGYGPVAEAILYHHEHIDGSGYPAGLIGNEIPLASRIIAVCSTYDTLTARETYRSPMTPQDAIAELRKVSGRQLDAELVEAFIATIERRGPLDFAHGDDADFEEELAFGRRARALAQPSSRA